MSQVYLEIGDLQTLTAFLSEAKKKGLLKDVSTDRVESLFKAKTFPIRVPVDLNAVLAVAENPIVRKAFGKKIESKTVDILNLALKTG